MLTKNCCSFYLKKMGEKWLFVKFFFCLSTTFSKLRFRKKYILVNILNKSSVFCLKFDNF